MILQILNMGDLKREFRNVAAYVNLPVAQLWIVTVAKEYLLNFEENLDGADRDENFRVYDRAKIKSLPGEPPPFPKLPDWAKKAVKRGEQLYWFDPIQPRRRRFWNENTGKIGRIVNWFNIEPPPEINWPELTFEEALRRANDWYREKGLG